MDNNINTIPAICPQCGAQQEVDPAQDAAICRYCGAPFSVQRAAGAYNERYCGARETGSAYASPGPTYYSEPQKPRKRRTFWWVVGWIFCFPIPLTILMLRNRKLPAAARYGIIALGWIVYLLLGVRSRTNRTMQPEPAVSTPAIVETTSTPRSTARPTPRPTAKPTPTAAPTDAPDDEEDTESETTEETSEPTPEPTPEPSPTPAGVTPEFKAAMDSYEAFFDEYCEFMKSMSSDPTDFNYLLQYADMMTQYADTMEKLDAIDEDELSPADDAYYIEVMARIEVKLLEAANYMG